MAPLKSISFFIFLCQMSTWAIADVNTYLDGIHNNPQALYSFFKVMPKGGELHYHLSGGAYPEAMLRIASKGDYCFEKNSWQIYPIQEGVCRGIVSNALMNQPDAYQQVLRAWSMKDFNPRGPETGHDHFFNTFAKFYRLESAHYPEILADIMRRAANQNEYYLEILVRPDNALLDQLSAPQNQSFDFEKRRLERLADPRFQLIVKQNIQEIKAAWQGVREHFSCAQHPQSKVCQLNLKFQQYTLREQALDRVFDEALLSFLVAEQSPYVVGVNLVQPEDGLIALRDYHRHMELFAFLHAQYPAVPISLHAGELAAQFVEPQALRFHIQEAVHLAHASRIGHGVAISYENNAEALMKYMAEQGIAVEINLISNAQILNVQGDDHPLNYYLDHHVPVVLSTDDEGILRTDLTSQYVEAVLNHGLRYSTIKQINRNALTYSFLPGHSIWSNPTQALPVSDCMVLNSRSCDVFVAKHEKARVQRDLERALIAFEAKY